jgi:response regulator RpfG family c-di-GMP phosphodiesterase
MAIDWERDWPIAAAAGLVVVGAIWASRARTEMVQRTVTLQPQPVDVAGIVQAQVAAQQARFQTAAQLASQYVQGVVALEESKLQAQIAQQQLQTQLRIAELQAEAAKAQAEAQARAVQAQAAAQQQSAFWTGLFGLLPVLFSLFSRQRTEQASLRRMLVSRPVRAQLEATRLLLEAVA